MENNDEQFTQQQTDRYVTVATKMSRSAAEKLARIARKKDLTIYELIQMVCDTLIRYMDDRHNLSAEIERAMSIFEHLDGWAGAMNLADPSVNREVAQAVYILGDGGDPDYPDPDKKRKNGFRAVMVSKPFCGCWNETNNVMHIFERIFNVCLPELYMKMYRAKIVLECNTVTEVINLLADAAVLERLNEENRREFEDAARTDSGKAYQYGARTKAHGHRTPDSVAMDQRIKFDDDDRESAEKEASL